MKRVAFPPTRTLVAAVLAAALFAWSGQALAAHGQAKPEKTGILLVAFGTSVPGAEKAYKNIEKLTKEALPGVEIRWAFSSKIIRQKLAQGKKPVKLASPAEALAKMMEEDFTHVVVQSLQTIPGQEFHDLSETARAFSGMPKGLKKVVVGLPLLAVTQDMERAAEALCAAAPKGRSAGEAVIFVGHGATHPANVYYAGLQYHLWKRDKLAFVGTVEGCPSQEDVLAELAKNNVKKAYLMPLLAVAGDHAQNDIAGDEPDSWKSALAKAGVAGVPVLKGTAEYDAVAAIWVEHLKEAMERLKAADSRTPKR